MQTSIRAYHSHARQSRAPGDPEKLRDELRLEAGDALTVESEGELLTLRPVRPGSPLRKEQGVWVFRSGKKTSAAVTDQVLREQREARNRQSVGGSL